MSVTSLLRLGLAIVALLLLVGQVTADLELSGDELADYYRNIKRDSDALSECLKSPGMQEHNARAIAYHNETLHKLRKARGIDPNLDLDRRDQKAADKWIAIPHEAKPGHSRDPQDIFNFHWNDAPYVHKGCALTPMSIYGPFWKDRQPLRQDIRAGERGIYLRLAMQVIDTTTCLPLHGAQVDVWHANAMGTYGEKMDSFLRGWQPTSGQGTVDFDTNFPGHYADRATHIHVVVRAPHEQRVANVGQIYFDQAIRDQVNKTERYSGNKNTFKTNSEDVLLQYDASDSFDPLVRWSRIGRSLEDGGLLGWITLGVNPTDRGIDQPPKPEKPDQKRDIIDWHLA